MEARATTTATETLSVIARLDDNPRYAGSAHDPATARALGYRGALIPGAFVYGYGTRVAVRLWGMDWIERGTIGARFRRPVYDGDELMVAAGPIEAGTQGVSGPLSVTNKSGEAVLLGSIALPRHLPALPAELPIQPLPESRPALGVGEVAPGMRVGTRGLLLTEEDVAASRRAFGETETIYEQQSVVHSGCLVRLTMSDTLQSFSFPIPVIFASVETQNFMAVRPGRRMSTSGVVTAVYERKGKHYFDSEEYLIAEGQGVVARHFRSNLYAMEGGD